MQIEEGKFYRTRGGEVMGPAKSSSPGTWNVGGPYYEDDGKFLGVDDPNYGLHLVEECQIPAAAAASQPVTSPDEYLGDGVYASFDGYQMWLAVNHHMNKVMALEPAVFANLVQYARKVGMK